MLNQTATADDSSTDSFPESDSARILFLYFAPILLILGTLGCTISTVVLFQLTRDILPSCLYLCLGMPLNLAVLFIWCGNDWLSYAFDTNIKAIAMLHNVSLCKFYPFVSQCLLELSIWLLVAMIIEVGFVYMRPHRIHKICTLDRARAVILLMIVLIVCVNTHCFWSYDLIEMDEDMNSGTGLTHSSYFSAGSLSFSTTKKRTSSLSGDSTKWFRCQMTAQPGKSEIFIDLALPVIAILVADLFPLCIVLSFTVIVLARWDNLTKSMTKEESFASINNAAASGSTVAKTTRNPKNKHFRLLFITEKDYIVVKQLHKGMLAICITYLVLLSPMCVYKIFKFIANLDSFAPIPSSPQLQAKLELGGVVCYLLMYLFLATKGFILMASSTLYRDHVIKLLRCCRGNGGTICNNKRSSIHQQNTANKMSGSYSYDAGTSKKQQLGKAAKRGSSPGHMYQSKSTHAGLSDGGGSKSCGSKEGRESQERLLNSKSCDYMDQCDAAYSGVVLANKRSCNGNGQSFVQPVNSSTFPREYAITSV